MGRLLQVGVLLASFVMLAGGILYVRAHHAAMPDYRVFKSEPQALRHVGGVVRGVAAGDSGGRDSTGGAAADCDAGGAGGVCADCVRNRAG